HGRAAGSRICVITAIGGRTRARAWSCDIRLDAIAAVPDNRAAAAKRGNGIGAGIQSPSRVRCCVERWRIRYSGTSWSGVTRGDYHHNAGSGLGFYSSLQLVADSATLRGRTTPGVDRNIRCLGRVGIHAVDPGRRQKPLHALDVSGRGAVALVHVTAANPFCTRRHSDLVTSAVIANCGTWAVRAMVQIITGEV